MARLKLLPALALFSHLYTSCSAFNALSTPEFDDQLLSLNVSSQIEIERFLLDWGHDEHELASQGGSQDEQQPLEPGFSVWRRACPLPGGGDCKSTSLCCSSSSGAWCCAGDIPVCCGKQSDAWCCGKDKTCCGRGCCNPGFSCCGTLYGKAKCCGAKRICCNKDTDAGFCCDSDQRCGTSGNCINPTTTVTRTTTLIGAKSVAGQTVTVTSERTSMRTSTDRTTEVVTVSSKGTATSWITSTITVTDTAVGGDVTGLVSSVAAKRWATALATPTEEPSVVYLRSKPSLDVIAHGLMARGVPVVRRDTITYTAWVTRTADSVSSFTVTSTSWDTTYQTTTIVDTVTSTTYVSATTTVTSTTTTTMHVKAEETLPVNNDDNGGGGGGGGGGNGGNNNDNNNNNNNNNGTNSTSSSSDKGVIIGGSVGGAAGVVLLAIAGFIIYKKRSNRNTPTSPRDSVHPTMAPQDGTYPPEMMPAVGGAVAMSSPSKSPPHSYSPYSQTSQAVPPSSGYTPYPGTTPSPGPPGQNAYQPVPYDQTVYEMGQTSPRAQVSEMYTAPVVHEADTVYPHERGVVAELGPGVTPAILTPGQPGYQQRPQ